MLYPQNILQVDSNKPTHLKSSSIVHQVVSNLFPDGQFDIGQDIGLVLWQLPFSFHQGVKVGDVDGGITKGPRKSWIHLAWKWVERVRCEYCLKACLSKKPCK